MLLRKLTYDFTLFWFKLRFLDLTLHYLNFGFCRDLFFVCFSLRLLNAMLFSDENNLFGHQFFLKVLVHCQSLSLKINYLFQSLKILKPLSISLPCENNISKLIPKTGDTEIPFDMYCPTVQKFIPKWICKDSKAYFPSGAAVKQNRKCNACTVFVDVVDGTA